MPTSSNKRARGKHFGNRVHHTGNKFILTSAEAQIIQGQIGMLQQHLMMTYGSLHERLAKLEPGVPQVVPPDELVPEMAAILPAESSSA